MQIIYSNGYIHHATSDCGRYAVAFGSLLIDGAELQWGKLWTAEGMTSAAQTDIDAVLALDANVRAANDATDAKVRAAIDERDRRRRDECPNRHLHSEQRDGSQTLYPWPYQPPVFRGHAKLSSLLRTSARDIGVAGMACQGLGVWRKRTMHSEEDDQCQHP